MVRISPAVIAIAVASLAAVPAAAVQRSFLASYGSDSNTTMNCSLANPCRSFTAGMSVVDPGGEVVVLDAAGYGAAVITKSITLTSNSGFYAGIAASSGTAVTIATAGVRVVLRGLSINGVGATHGVVMTNGDSLSIENCVISNFSAGNGVHVNVLDAKVRIIDSLIRDNDRGVVIQGGAKAAIEGSKLVSNATTGLYVYNQAPSSVTDVSVTGTLLAHNGTGVHAFETTASALNRVAVIRSTIAHNANYGLRSQFSGGPTVVSVSDSLVMQNGVGFSQEGGGSTLESLGNNTVRANGPDTGTVTSVAPR